MRSVIAALGMSFGSGFGSAITGFYSDRPASYFSNHSGLGLAISKQIADAECGLIWAENVRAPDTKDSAPSDGARSVVGLPV
jgi:two-component system sensor histidine kinase ChvG